MRKSEKCLRETLIYVNLHVSQKVQEIANTLQGNGNIEISAEGMDILRCRMREIAVAAYTAGQKVMKKR